MADGSPTWVDKLGDKLHWKCFVFTSRTPPQKKNLLEQ